MAKQFYQEDPNQQQGELVAVRLPKKRGRKIKTINVEDLARAVSLWLNYQATVCSSVNLLHEASFRYPITEYLERKERSISKLEEDHPIFENRPTDFQWKLKNKKYYLECKYVKYGYTNKKQEFQRYIDDLCRLYYCIEDNKIDICYFLVCGNRKDIEDCFVESDPTEVKKRDINKKRYNYLLDLKKNSNKELNFDIGLQAEAVGMSENQKLGIEMNKFYAHFINDYKTNIQDENKEGHPLYDAISLTMNCLYEADKNDEQCVYIWQIIKGKFGSRNNEPKIID